MSTLSTVLSILSAFLLISIPQYSPNVFEFRGYSFALEMHHQWYNHQHLEPHASQKSPFLSHLWTAVDIWGNLLFKSMCYHSQKVIGECSWFSWRKNSSRFACLDLQPTYKLEYNWIRSFNAVVSLFNLDPLTILLHWKRANLFFFAVA